LSDTIAHLAGHAGSAALADTLAHELNLRPTPCRATDLPDAVLAVAPACERRYRNLALPVITLPRSELGSPGLKGGVVVCGARDERDAPALAIAAAVAGALYLPLLLVHVLPLVSRLVAGVPGVPQVYGVTLEDKAWTKAMLERLAIAAGVEAPADDECRVVRGAPGATLAALGQSLDAALVVVSATTRHWVFRAFAPSVAGYLVRHSARPVLVCPTHPAPAMRVREAIAA
jgi:nucleotide-binding universal stress UspA family protein